MLPSDFLTKILYVFLISPMDSTCPPISSSILSVWYCSVSINHEFPPYTLFSSLLLFLNLTDPNNLLNTLFSITPNVRDHVLRPHKTAGKIMVSCFDF
jgi:hypothetical protein